MTVEEATEIEDKVIRVIEIYNEVTSLSATSKPKIPSWLISLLDISSTLDSCMLNGSPPQMNMMGDLVLPPGNIYKPVQLITQSTEDDKTKLEEEFIHGVSRFNCEDEILLNSEMDDEWYQEAEEPTSKVKAESKHSQGKV